MCYTNNSAQCGTHIHYHAHNVERGQHGFMSLHQVVMQDWTYRGTCTCVYMYTNGTQPLYSLTEHHDIGCCCICLEDYVVSRTLIHYATCDSALVVSTVICRPHIHTELVSMATVKQPQIYQLTILEPLYTSWKWWIS